MELIPLLTLKKHKIYTGPTANTITTNELLDQIKTDTPTYFYDHDGITKDKPNFCLYQKIGTKIQVWTDAAPRVLGDIVDTIMAGAQRITIRPLIWTETTIDHIQEITEQQLYIHQEQDTLSLPLPTADGIVLFDQTHHPQNNFKLESHLKTLALKTTVYIYDSNKNNYTYWQKLGITGILIDLEHYPEYLAHVR